MGKKYQLVGILSVEKKLSRKLETTANPSYPEKCAKLTSVLLRVAGKEKFNFPRSKRICMNVTDEMVRAEIDVMNRVADLPIDHLALAVASNIWRASQLFRNAIESTVLRPHNLTWASFSTLFIVWVWEPITMSAIAESQNVSRPTITSTVGLLEKRGLCYRQPSVTGDGRSVQVCLTPQGRTLIETVFPQVNQGETHFVNGLPAEAQHTLATLLRKLIKHYTENS